MQNKSVLATAECFIYCGCGLPATGNRGTGPDLLSRRCVACQHPRCGCYGKSADAFGWLSFSGHQHGESAGGSLIISRVTTGLQGLERRARELRSSSVLPSGGLALAGCRAPTELLSLRFLKRSGGENGIKKLVGREEGRDITFQLPSWAKQTLHGEN